MRYTHRQWIIQVPDEFINLVPLNSSQRDELFEEIITQWLKTRLTPSWIDTITRIHDNEMTPEEFDNLFRSKRDAIFRWMFRSDI